jgi:hypothetical protein
MLVKVATKQDFCRDDRVSSKIENRKKMDFLNIAKIVTLKIMQVL